MKFAAKIISMVLVMVVLVSCFAMSASAISSVPYKGYNYDPYGNATAAPIGYVPEDIFSYADMGLDTALSTPEDFFIYNDEIYIADTGNSRIVVLDSNFKFVREYTQFTADDGTAYTTDYPHCVYVKNDEIFVVTTRTEKDEKGVDVQNGYVITADMNGNFKRIFKKPEDSTLEISSFDPRSVVADDAGYVYVRALGILEGLIVYDADGNFIQYYGANKVVLTWQLAVQQAWKKIFSREATSTMIRAVPTEMSNMFIDDEGFIYTVTDTATVAKDLRIRKLNALGDNILESDENALVKTVYGDRETGRSGVNTVDTRFVDIYVDSDGIIAALDNERSRVFVYDQRSTLLTVFGAMGTQKGAVTASGGVAISKLGDKYVVLDNVRGVFVTYSPTDYMEKLLIADKYYMSGFYSEGEEYWRDVLQYDANNARAYAAIGKALLEQERYQESLRYLELGQDRTSYSLALQEYRKDYLNENYMWIVPVLVAAIVAVVFLYRLIRKALGLQNKKNKIRFK